jgi:hypothetical protein
MPLSYHILVPSSSYLFMYLPNVILCIILFGKKAEVRIKANRNTLRIYIKEIPIAIK